MTDQPPTSEAPSVPEAVPVCPRHPDRESYVRCQRCERPVCPQCQRPAAVGVQCVDCVKEQAKTVRAPRSVFGGRAGTGRPVVTQTIIGLCVAAFALQWTVPDFTDRYDFIPALAIAEPVRFLSSAFLHSQGLLIHILFNMYFLWLLGQDMEPLLGRARFVAVYLISAVGGSVGLFLLVPAGPYPGNWYAPAVGASGAVFGLLGALIVLNRKLGRDNAGLITLVVINGIIGFLPGWNIAWQAHLGGLVTGALCALVIAYAPRERRAFVHVAGLALVMALLVVLVAVKASTVPAAYLA